MAAKIAGSWNLHRLTVQHDVRLDFLVLFSSSSALLGTAGQANYAAANAFLDGLASYRKQKGLPCLSINWGSWGEVGMTARLQLEHQLQQRGEGIIAPQQGVPLLARLLRSTQLPASMAVLPINWSRFLEQQLVVPPFLTDFQKTAKHVLAKHVLRDEVSTLREELGAASAQERKQLLAAHVRAQVAQTLGLLASTDIASDAGFFALGMDSLASIELRNNLQASLDCSLSPTLTFSYPTVERLTDYLEERLFATSKPSPVKSATTTTSKPQSVRDSELSPAQSHDMLESLDITQDAEEIAQILAKQLGL